jgi:hypothetical protein
MECTRELEVYIIPLIVVMAAALRVVVLAEVVVVDFQVVVHLEVGRL